MGRPGVVYFLEGGINQEHYCVEGSGELNKSLHSLQNSLLTGKHELLLLLHSLLLQVDKEGQKVTSTYQRGTTTQSTLVLAELPAFY